MKTLLACCATAVVCFGIAAVTGFASHSSPRSAQTRYLTAHIGDDVNFVGLDFFCSTRATDPDHHDPGPSMYCDRFSDERNSAAVGVSKYHLHLSRTNSNYWDYTIARSP
jgi:hypothetical protein